MALALIIILLVVLYTNIEFSIQTASYPQYAPSDAWCNSLLWMKDNTPEPMGDPDVYYHETHLYFLFPIEKRVYPETAYGVLACHDYGYWISRIAHRMPNANPSQATEPTPLVARFFTSQDEESARRIAEELGTAYVIIDYATAISKVSAIVIWAGGEPSDYSDVYYLPQGKGLMPIRLYYPDYYRSLSTRLYNFDGKAVTPGSVAVISYEEKGGRKYIISNRRFDTYEEAEAYLTAMADEEITWAVAL